MRLFEVWVNKGIPGEDPCVETFEVEDDATEAEVDAAGSEALDILIGNCLDTGWAEVEAGKSSLTEKIKKRRGR